MLFCPYLSSSANVFRSRTAKVWSATRNNTKNQIKNMFNTNSKGRQHETHSNIYWAQQTTSSKNARKSIQTYAKHNKQQAETARTNQFKDMLNTINSKQKQNQQVHSNICQTQQKTNRNNTKHQPKDMPNMDLAMCTDPNTFAFSASRPAQGGPFVCTHNATDSCCGLIYDATQRTRKSHPPMNSQNSSWQAKPDLAPPQMPKQCLPKKQATTD